MALIATGAAACTLVLSSMPASASTVREDEWWLSTLGVRQAWTTSQGTGITIAVLSDGVDASQADLSGSVTTGPDLTGAASSQSRGPYFGQLGTGIASIIAGHGHGSGSSTGMLGVAPQAKILSVRVTLPANDPLLSATTTASALPNAIAAGIKFAVAHGAKVIDLPIDPGQPGTSGTGGAAGAAGGSAAEAAAVKYALGRGVVLVAPAGDDGGASDAANYPAAYPGVIAVGAFDQSFAKPSWTSHQSYVAVTAAGVNVEAAAPGGGYQTINGTSAASAVVSGMVALIRARYPSLTVRQVTKALTTSTVRRSATPGSGHGTVNAARALSAAAAEAPAGPKAGAGALPLATQGAPTPAQQQGLSKTLIRDGIISGVLLVLLLLLVLLYAIATRRRRIRRQEAVAAEWTGRKTLLRYPNAAAGDPERMLEFFAAPALQPPQAATTAAPPSTGSGVFADPNRQAVGTPAGTGPLPRRAVGGEPGASAWGAADAGARPRLGPASREVSRRPAVSGAPPWEPASQPSGDLPWANAASQGPADSWAGSTPVAPNGAAQARAARLAGAGSVSGGAPAAPGSTAASGAAPAARGAFAAVEAVSAARAELAARRANPAASVAEQAAEAAAGAHAAAQPARARQAQPAETQSPWQPQPGRPARPPWETSPQPAFRAPERPQSEPGAGTPWQPDWQSPRGGEAPDITWPGRPSGTGPAGPSAAGRLDWSRNSASEATDIAAAAAREGYAPPSALQRPGDPLPVRQPRHATSSAPPSPSGSLWEKATEPPARQGEALDSSGRPIYVWNPDDATDSYPARPAELAEEQADWRPQRPRWGGRQ